MYKIGLSTCNKVISEKLFADYRKAEIDAMEISMEADQYDELNFALTSKSAKQYDIDLWSCHLPFGPFHRFDISNSDLARNTLAYFSELIKKASDIGIDKFIVHASGEPIKSDREERMKQAKESLAELAEIAAANGALIAVEDLPRTCLGNHSEEIAELLNAHSALKVCFDTNHLLSEDASQFIMKLGDKIVTTHISDYDFVNERHWLPGEGKLNWNEILNAFQAIDYQGVWMYEIAFACPKTILRERDLTCEDFMLNAKELFDGKHPTVISKQKPNLGFWE